MLRATSFSFTCLLLASMGSLAYGQGIQGSGITSGVAGGISSGGLGGGGVGGGGSAGGPTTNQGIAGSSIAQALTGSRDTALQSTGFLNQNSQAGGGFLGAQGANAGQGGRGNQFGNAGGFNTFGGGRGGFGGQGGRGFQPQQQRPSRLVRTRLIIASDFSYPKVPMTAIESNLNTQFARISQLTARGTASGSVKRVSSSALRGSRITTVTNGRTVVLRGQVASERDRQVAERMAKMEPGVDSVVNELAVVGN